MDGLLMTPVSSNSFFRVNQPLLLAATTSNLTSMVTSVGRREREGRVATELETEVTLGYMTRVKDRAVFCRDVI